MFPLHLSKLRLVLYYLLIHGHRDFLIKRKKKKKKKMKVFKQSLKLLRSLQCNQQIPGAAKASKEMCQERYQHNQNFTDLLIPISGVPLLFLRSVS